MDEAAQFGMVEPGACYWYKQICPPTKEARETVATFGELASVCLDEAGLGGQQQERV